MTIAQLFGVLVKEPFNWDRDLLRNTTLRWKFELVESQREKPRPPPASAEEVYHSMLEIGLSLTQPSDKPAEEAKRIAAAENIARLAADGFRRKQALKAAAQDEAEKQKKTRRHGDKETRRKKR